MALLRETGNYNGTFQNFGFVLADLRIVVVPIQITHCVNGEVQPGGEHFFPLKY